MKYRILKMNMEYTTACLIKRYHQQLKTKVDTVLVKLLLALVEAPTGRV